MSYYINMILFVGDENFFSDLPRSSQSMTKQAVVSRGGGGAPLCPPCLVSLKVICVLFLKKKIS